MYAEAVDLRSLWQALSEDPEMPDRYELNEIGEILSPGNRKAEIDHKIRAFPGSGSDEVIVVAMDGAITFHRPDGQHPESAMGVKLALPAELFRY
jgi:hypothetical protein